MVISFSSLALNDKPCNAARQDRCETMNRCSAKMEQHFLWIEALAKRPGMYAGSHELRDVATYFRGYMAALHGSGVLPAAVWGEWVAERFGIWHPAWSWERTLLHSFGSEAAAIAALPQLFRAYVADLHGIGAKGIHLRHQKRFSEDGCDAQQRVPAQTFTKDPS